MTGTVSNPYNSPAPYEGKIQQGRENREWGKEAEELAAQYFLRQGYLVRERNWRVGRMEIDLILETGRTIVFVEVKARKGDNQDPVEAVDWKKRQRLVRCADIYLRHLEKRYEYRFDIVSFTGTSESHKMVHYADAFLPGVNGGTR